jgi:hypothetical protein
MKVGQDLRLKPGPQCASVAPGQVPVDKSGPVVTLLDADPVFNAADASAEMVARFKATDDLTGVRTVYATARGPSGQRIGLFYRNVYPAIKANGLLHSGTGHPYLEPGVYKIEELYAYDEANNVRVYDEAAVQALGNSTVIVKNRLGFDATPPALVRGRILSPTIWLTDTQPGTHTPRYAGVEAEVSDVGNTATAGLREAQMAFCLLDGSACLYLTNGNYGEGRPGAEKVAVRLGSSLYYTVTPGQYHMASFTAIDRAGNAQILLSREFGGETDFSQYFRTLTITVEP